MRRTYSIPAGSISRAHQFANCLCKTTIDQLRPTQAVVGMNAVKTKRDKLERHGRRRLGKLVANRPIPAVLGPASELYMIDHHHFGLALWHAEFDYAYVDIIDDKSHLSQAAFWKAMAQDGRAYLYDEAGHPIEARDMPRGLQDLRHDPFRDLAWLVREAGGFRKTAVPYAEFFWANYLRANAASQTGRRRAGMSFETALKLCRDPAAAHLPGFNGAE